VIFAITNIFFVIHIFILNIYVKIELFFSHMHHFHIFQYLVIITGISLTN